jgi:hypothetical protein
VLGRRTAAGRRWIVFAALLAPMLVPATAGADYRSAIMADTPSGYWRLGETSGNAGTYAGGVTLDQPGAIADVNAAARFDGVNDGVSVPDSNTLDMPSAVTVEAWVKRTKSGSQVILGKPGNGTHRNENYSLWLDNQNRVRAYFGSGSSSITGTRASRTRRHPRSRSRSRPEGRSGPRRRTSAALPATRAATPSW